jgi:hypothetical protein
MTMADIDQVSLALAQAETGALDGPPRACGAGWRWSPRKIEKPDADRQNARRDTAAAYAKQREEAAKVVDSLSPQTPARHVSNELTAERNKARDIVAGRLEEMQAEAAKAKKYAETELGRARTTYNAALHSETLLVLQGKSLIELEDARRYTANCAAQYAEAVAAAERAAAHLARIDEAVVPVPNLTQTDTLEALVRVLGIDTSHTASSRTSMS